METHLALTIIGAVLSLVGILFFLIPEKVNEKVMTDLSDSAIQPAAALRSVLGGSAMWSGLIAILSRDFPAAQASSLLTAYGIGMSIMLVSILFIKPRKFSDDIPLPPVVMFVILIAIAFYSA